MTQEKKKTKIGKLLSSKAVKWIVNVAAKKVIGEPILGVKDSLLPNISDNKSSQIGGEGKIAPVRATASWIVAVVAICGTALIGFLFWKGYGLAEISVFIRHASEILEQIEAITPVE